MTYYRTYRPQKIAELDNLRLRETLTALLSQKNIPHAFLFTGPKGLGKTSTARLIAKSVNCERRKEGTVEPCNECPSCVAITNGSHMDVLEIDGASNRGIDEIRDLREKVKLAPSSAKKKIYIIDEVHMLTTEAFNALLKTIEEPPPHVIFIFCTTEPQKIPATILSRCFHISLIRATQSEIIHSLQRIVRGEKILVTSQALETIAKLADGGFRDAAKILEEVEAVSKGNEITEDFIESHFYKTTNILLTVNNFLSMITKVPPDTKDALLVIQQLAEQGTDMKFFITQLVTRLHGILLNQMEVQNTNSRNPDNLSLSTELVQNYIALFSEVYQQTKSAIIPQMPLELAVISLSISNKEYVIEPKKSIFTLDAAVKKEKNLKVQNILMPSEKKVEKKESTVNQENLSENTMTASHMLDNVIYKVKPLNHSLAGLLRGCSITKVDEKTITIEAAYKFHKEKIMEIRNITILESAFKELTGKDRKIMIELKQ